ncbi:hypothetical protein [Allorhizocola rhizosphaerae]|uniref:hypothetical protein n=1 Tax=Allorhizocola rhizosphaerae TaxID=1872709 RepID=UPI000E3B6A59|nr:hypothetical protein [Allorhizocola rhizosphaerae]
MPILTRVLRVVLATLQVLLGGVRWLALQTYRQRTIGVTASPQLARLLDVLFVTVAAHMTLAAGLVVWRGPLNWLWAIPVVAIGLGLGVWLRNRWTIVALIVLQLAGLALVWLPIVAALAVALLACVIATAWARALWRAALAGLLLGVFTGGAGLVVGLFVPAFPLWLTAGLLLIGLVLALRVPGTPREQPVVPRQTPHPPPQPEGYTVYRPSSLDD